MTTPTLPNAPSTDLTPAQEPSPGLGEEGARLYRRILVAVDFSEHSNQTVAHGTNLAARCGAEVTLLHVLQIPEYASVPYQGNPHLNVDELTACFSGAEHSVVKQQAKEKLAALEARVHQQGIKAESLLYEGHPFEQIVEVAKSTGADLIVIGSHGQGGLTRLTRLLIGSTAERVVQWAPCPVLVVKGAESGRTDSGT
jgi:nucleotide-binding universal stress UspA family protein